MPSTPSNPVTSIRSVLPLCHREGLRTYASATFSGPQAAHLQMPTLPPFRSGSCFGVKVSPGGTIVVTFCPSRSDRKSEPSFRFGHRADGPQSDGCRPRPPPRCHVSPSISAVLYYPVKIKIKKLC